MESNISLVIFTLLGQAVAGMVLYMAIGCFIGKNRPYRLQGIFAVAMLAIGAMASLGHLSDPLISFYSITNLGTSWLSREILFLGILGGFLLAWVLLQKKVLLLISALGGLGIVYVMGRIYSIPTVPFWDTSLTFPVFLSSMLLLGPTTLLLADAIQNRHNPAALERQIMGWQPVAISIGFILRMFFAVMQAMTVAGTTASKELLWAHAGLLLLGAGTLLLCLTRKAAFGMEKSGYTSGLLVLLIIMVACIWAGELCGRIAFYSALTTFGM